jgi:hypothetical protein
MRYLARISAPRAAAVVLLASAGMAAAQDSASRTTEEKQIIAAICGREMPKLGAAGCTCLAERAAEELDDRHRAYLILTVTHPRAAEQDPMAQAQPDLRLLAEFLDRAATACAPPGTLPAN